MTNVNAAQREVHQTALLNHWGTYLWTTDAELNMVMMNDRAQLFVENLIGSGNIENITFEQIIRRQSLLTFKVWVEHIEKARELKQAVSFSYNEMEDSRFTNIKALVRPIYNNSELIGYCCGFEDDTELFLINRLNELKSQFKSQALRITDTSDLLWALTDAILSQLFLEDAMILLKEGQFLKIAAAYGSKRKGYRQAYDDLQIPLDKGITGHVARNGVSALVNDTSKDPRYFAEHFQAQSEVVVPIRVHDDIIGVINCESSYKDFFKPVHLQLLEEVADVAATRMAQIEDRKKLEKLEEHHQAVLRSMPSGYLLIDEQYRLMHFNRSAEKGFNKFLGRQLQRHKEPADYVPPALTDAFLKNTAKALKGENVSSIRKLAVENAHDVWLRLTYTPAYNNLNQIFGVAIIIENISDIKLQEKEVTEKNLRLEKSNKELDKFVYSVSHDLRAPLSSMMGLNKLIGMSQNMEEVMEFSNMLQDAADSMDSFIRKILEYSRNSRTEIDKEWVSLKDEFKDACQKIRFMRGFNAIEFKTNFEVDQVLTDQYRLGIIFNNLLSNSVKYQDEEKENRYINIEAKNAGNGSLQMVFTDNGIGIEEQHLGGLFEMFFKANSSHYGSGLGLYIVREALDALNGSATVESKLGQGTTFKIIIPNAL